MFSLNPFFEREWRGHFRRPSAFLSVGLLGIAMSVLVWVGAWRLGFLPAVTVRQWRHDGHMILDTYRWIGGFAFWGTALLMGAAGVSEAKENATWDDLLLCPLEGRGLVVGHVLSCTLSLFLWQLVLVPPLLVAGRCFGALPIEVGGVMMCHLLLIVQGVALGFWGALRGRHITEGLLMSLSTIGIMLLQGAVVLGATFCGLVAVAYLGFLISAPPRSMTDPILLLRSFGSLVLGVTGIGAVVPVKFAGSSVTLPFVLFLGQVLGVGLLLKWSAWQVSYPTRDFGGRPSIPIVEGKHHNSHIHLLYAVWSWTLTPQQVETFPQWERFSGSGSEEENNSSDLPTQLLARRKNLDYLPGIRPLGAAIRRWRFPISPLLMRVNPVLWLDLTRVLSLRVPDSPLPALILIPLVCCVGFLFIKALLVVTGWMDSAHYWTAGDQRVLRDGWESLRSVLFLAALASGPLWGARGYIVERRSDLLAELELTRLSAGTMWWGKLFARLIAFALFSMPLLGVVGFFALNWPGKDGASEIRNTLFSTYLLATASLLVCLCVSDVCRKELTTFLWCGALTFTGGLLWWQFPGLPWTNCHAIIAVVAGGYLLWRLKRLGFR